MQIALKNKNTYLTNKNDDLFLTADCLIRLNIIKSSWNIVLGDVNVKPTSYSKIYMDKSFVEVALIQFNDRIISHKDFCRTFLDQIHPFQDGNGSTCKSFIFDQKK